MNGKQAKKIRRAAEAKTVGQYVRNYEHEAKRSVRGGQLGISSMVRLTPGCTRTAMKKAKKEYLVGMR